jgi:hypothetical protein
MVRKPTHTQTDCAHCEHAETLRNALNSIQPMVQKLLSALRSVDKHFSQEQHLKEQLATNSLQLLAELTADVRNSAELAIDRFWSDEAERLSLPEEIPKEAALEQPTRPRPFCYGAKLVQSGKSHNDLESLRSTEWGIVCKFCNLEIGTYPSIRLKSDHELRDQAKLPAVDILLREEAIETRSLLAASHLIACRSFENRGAFYRCLPCHQRGRLVDLRSASAFEEHMQKHPTFVLKQDRERKNSLLMEGTNRFLATTLVGKNTIPLDNIGVMLNSQEDVPKKDVSESKELEASDRIYCGSSNGSCSESDEIDSRHGGRREKRVSNPAIEEEMRGDGSFKDKQDLAMFHMPVKSLVSGGHTMREPVSSQSRFHGPPVLRNPTERVTEDSFLVAWESSGEIHGSAEEGIDTDDTKSLSHPRTSHFRIYRRPISDSALQHSKAASSDSSRNRLVHNNQEASTSIERSDNSIVRTSTPF